MDADKEFYVYELWFQNWDQPFYVGKTFSGSYRLSNHIAEAKKGRSKSLKSKYIRKYHLRGGIALHEVVVAKFTNEIECMEVESKLIEKYGLLSTGSGPLTNLTFGWEGVKGNRLSSEAIQELKNRGVWFYNRASNTVPISVYSENGTFIETLPSVKEVSDKYGWTRANVPKVCTQEAGRLFIKDRDGIRYRLSYSEFPEGLPESFHKAQHKGSSLSRRVIATGDYGVTKFSSLAEASKYAGVSICVMRRVILLELPHHGHHWAYAEEYPPRKTGIPRKVAQLDLGGNLVATFDSISEAARVMGTTKSVIGNAASKRQKTSMGYLWEYLE